jgi:hypothetical protein
MASRYDYDPEQTENVNPEVAQRFYDTATNMAIQPGGRGPEQTPPDARWIMGALAAQERYNPDEGAANATLWRDPSEIAAARMRGPYNRTQPNSAFGDSYLTTARTPDTSPAVYPTAAGFNITQHDIDAGTEAALAVSSGGLATKGVKPGSILTPTGFDPAGFTAETLTPEAALAQRQAIRSADYQKSIAAQEKQAARDTLANQKLAEEAAALRGTFPQYAEAYPPTGPGTPTIDPKSGKAYMAKTNTPDAEAFAEARRIQQLDMDTHGYEPYFDPAKRFHADTSQYPPMLDTGDYMPKTAAALKTWTERFDVPETRAALQRAYASGQKVQDAEHWYMMGQLEQEYTREFGPEIGRARFRNDFGGAMAATTGGADPTSNLLMGHYANYLRYKGQDFPRVSPAEQEQMKAFSESQGKPYVDAKGRPIDKTGDIAAYGLPAPIGGQYAAGNLDQYERVFREVAQGKDLGKALEDANPKRLDFMQSFMGHPASFTWDKQMTAGATRGLPKEYDAPDLGYGILERVAREEAVKAGKPAQEFQGVGWAGFKGEGEAAEPLGGKFQGPKGFGNVKYEGPMISHVNDTIERTHRLTGMPKAEIVRRGLVRGEIPLYGLGGAMTMGALASQDYQPEERM